jgi:spermidine synthase
MIGGGAYSVPKDLLSNLPNVKIDVAEIEPSLFDLAKKYFRVPDDPRLNNFVKDGRRFLYDSDKKYDFIFSDAYSSLYSTPEHLTTQEFFKIAKNKLNDKGVFIANVIGSLSLQKPSLLLSEIKTFKTVFANSYFFAVNSPQSSDLQNIIFIGYNGADAIDFNSASWQAKIKESQNPIIGNLAEKKINLNKFDFSLHPILTDDFAPVEYLVAKELEKSQY